jgi:hypothetical protein
MRNYLVARDSVFICDPNSANPTIYKTLGTAQLMTPDSHIVKYLRATPARAAASEMLEELISALETDYYGKWFIPTEKLKALIAKAGEQL